MLTINSIIDKIKNFNAKVFFEWISVISMHPSNQKYLLRFELIIAAFFSIEEERFTNRKKKREDIISFFDEINSDFDKHFQMFEDFIPFQQHKLIPLFLHGRKYYFFYGFVENPYSRLKVLAHVITSIEAGKHKGLIEIQKQFLKSLETQTYILKEIVDTEESYLEQDSVLIPTQSYFEKLNESIKIKNYDDLEVCNLGCLHKEQNSIIEKCLNFENPYLIKSSIGQIGEYCYVLFPQNHIEHFGYRLKNVINNSLSYQEIWDDLKANFEIRLFKLCTNLFSLGSSVFEIYSHKSSDENLLEKYNITCGFLFDTNKLILFTALPCRESKDYYDTAQNILGKKEELLQLNKTIASSDEIGVGIYKYSKIRGIQTKELEIWNILVSEQISMEPSTYSIKKDSDNFHITEIGDLEFTIEKLMEHRESSDLSFVKFLQNDRDFMNSKYSMITTNYTDRIAMYFSGTEGYFMFGKNPDFMNIVPYQGNQYECEYYFEKYKALIYDILEKKFPDKFNVIEHLEGRYYRAVDTAELHVLYVVAFEEYPILIYLPKEYSFLPKIDKEFIVLMLPQLIAFYIDEFSELVFKLLQYTEIFYTEYSLMLTSNVALTQEENKLSYLLPIVSNLKEEPFIIETKRLENGAVRTFIIANTMNQEPLIKLFEPDDNSAEQFILRSVVESILIFYGSKNTESKSRLFIEKYVPKTEKSFSFNLIESENPKIDSYGSFVKLNDSDIVNVNRLFAEHLATLQIEPGTFYGEEAKRINGLIFDFLQTLLENNIKKFNRNTIVFAYKQLELIEGKRALNSVKLGMKKNRKLRYDLKEYTQKDFTSLAHLSSYVKHIAQTILKVNPNGHSQITITDWTFLLGIVAALMETNHIYEYINYDLSPHKLVISEMFEIKSEKLSDKIDHQKWQSELVENRITNTQNAYEKSIIEKEENINSENAEERIEDKSMLSKKLVELDELHKFEFGFSLAKKIKIIHILSRSTFYSPNMQPLSFVSLDDIIGHIKNFTEADVDVDEIALIINDLSLDYNSYVSDENMIPMELLRIKNRLNVCPIIKIEDKFLYGNQMCKFSYDLWKNEIIDGDLPYKVDNAAIKKKLDELHRINSKQLEIDATDELKKIFGSGYVLANLKKFHIISPDFPKYPPCGEIDILCIDQDKKVVYVFEAKSILQSNRPYSISLTFRDFFGTKGKRYNQKLNKKFEFVNDNIEKFLHFFSLEYSVEWQVKKAFVVDKEVFAAYHTDYKVDFVKVNQIREYVKGAAT